MTIDELRRAAHAVPFRPFTIHMADGHTYRVPHPEFIAPAPRGRVAVVFDHSGTNILDVPLMTKLHYETSGAAGAEAS